MPQAATIKSLPRAFRMMKTMQAQGIEWGEDYRRAGALALKDVLEGRMAAGVDRHLDEMAERGAGRPAQRQLPPLADDGAGRDRAQRPAHAELERARGGARLRPARGPHRPHPLRRLHQRKLKPGSAHDGVVDPWGWAHEVPNLFVSDGSVFLSAGAANPTLTVVALAIRQAEHIAAMMSAGEL